MALPLKQIINVLFSVYTNLEALASKEYVGIESCLLTVPISNSAAENLNIFDSSGVRTKSAELVWTFPKTMCNAAGNREM